MVYRRQRIRERIPESRRESACSLAVPISCDIIAHVMTTQPALLRKIPPPLSIEARPGWKVQRCQDFAEMRVAAIRHWQKAGASARAAAAWGLVREAWELAKRPAHELRLQRTVTVLHKA